LDNYEQIPFKVINYIGSEINYGGRVTDDKDVRLIKKILETYINEGALTTGFKYSESGIYHSPAAGYLKLYFRFLSRLH
jgi:dynein heavy chain, axonemal